jgi:microcystin-dependent protein
MADPFVAEIRIVGFNFAPRGWAHCNGQLLPISQNTALFSLLGTTYGGNGQTTFALPNLQGRAPMHSGLGPGLSNRTLGDFGGEQTVTLGVTQIPSHRHALLAADATANASTPAGGLFARAQEDTFAPAGNKTVTPMHSAAVGSTGGGLPHNNMQPYLAMNFIIALQGIFPPRS